MFNNAGHALEWAYNTAAKPIVKLSGINHMRQQPAKAAQNMLLLNLTAEDRHGQAALIIGMVERLPDPARKEYLAAKFGMRLDRTDMPALVRQACAGLNGSYALGMGLDKTQAVYRIISSYFRGQMGYREIRRLLGCRDQSAIMAKNCLFDTLDIIHNQAMADITEVLIDHGLIREAEVRY